MLSTSTSQQPPCGAETETSSTKPTELSWAATTDGKRKSLGPEGWENSTGFGRKNSGGADCAGGSSRTCVAGGVDGSGSVQRDKLKQSDGPNTGVRGTAGTEEGGAYSPPFKYLPPTPPQALYPRSEPELLTNSFSGSSKAMRNEPGGDKYDCKSSGHHTANRSDDLSGESSSARAGHYSGDSVAGRRRSAMASGTSLEAEEVGGTDGEERGGEVGNGRVAQIAEGLLWVQKHPVLAAVIWMFGKVLAPGADEERAWEDQATSPSTGQGQGTRKDHPHSPTGGVAGSGMDGGGDKRRWSIGGVSEEEGSTIREGDDDGRRGMWRGKVNSKGKLSWSDEFGGSLAEYYEDDRGMMVSDATSVDDGSEPKGVGIARSVSSTLASGDIAGGYWCNDRNDNASASHEQTSWNATTQRRGGADAVSGVSEGKISADVNISSRRQPKGYSENQSGTGAERAEDLSADRSRTSERDEPGVGSAEVAMRALNHSKGRGSSVLASRESGGKTAGTYGFARHEDTFYEDMSDAMRGQEEEPPCPVSADVPSQDEGVYATGASCVPNTTEGSSERRGDDGGFLPRTTASPGAGSAGGTPHGAAPGTWSPQWGWYVSMTPPQDLYPTTAKTPPSSTEPVDAPSSLKGRPPRP